MKVCIKTPARLHLGLIDLNGDLGRLFGGLGVGINKPNVLLEAEPSEKFSVSGEESSLVTSIAKRFFSAYSMKTNVKINVKKVVPVHVGLGSGTQLSLAVATAVAIVLNIKASTQEIALAMGRCKRTCVGTAIFHQGGFVVDGGKPTQNGVCIPNKFPPLIFRQPFPEEWRFVVVIPNVNKGLANDEERKAFKQVPKMPPEQVGKVCRLTMMKLLPAIAENDIAAFGGALTQVQATIGDTFAPAQSGRYASQAASDTIAFLQKMGAHGVGQSSWGPSVYGLFHEKQAIEVKPKVQSFIKESLDGDVFIAKANNKGACIRTTN